MVIDELNNRHMIADEGKVLCRISDGWVAGKEIFLGYTYQIGGELLDEPLWELPEDYEEVDDITIEDITNDMFDAEVQVLTDPSTSLISLEEPVEEQPLEPQQVQLAELLVTALNEIEILKQQVAELKG